MFDRLLTISEVSEQLQLRPKTIHGLCREGKLAYVQVTARERRFTIEQVDQFIKRRTIEAPKKLIDSGTPNRLPSPAKSRQGGQKGSVGDSARAQLLQEMRSWQL